MIRLFFISIPPQMRTHIVNRMVTACRCCFYHIIEYDLLHVHSLSCVAFGIFGFRFRNSPYTVKSIHWNDVNRVAHAKKKETNEEVHISTISTLATLSNCMKYLPKKNVLVTSAYISSTKYSCTVSIMTACCLHGIYIDSIVFEFCVMKQPTSSSLITS